MAVHENTIKLLFIKMGFLLAITFILSGCGLGYQYTAFEDKEFEITKKNIHIWKKDINLITSDPTYSKQYIDGIEIYIFNKFSLTRKDNYIYVLFPFKYSLSDIEASTEHYYKSGELIKVILRNSKMKEKGFGFACAPPFWGGSWCEILP